MKKYISVIILVILILATFSGCSSNHSGYSDSSSILQSQGVFTVDDIANAIEQVTDDNTTVLDTMVVDLNFDGEDELLILSSWGKNEIHLFRKVDSKINEASVFGMGMLDYISKLNLFPCKENGNLFYCFEFHYDNGGVMAADVIAAIKESGENKFQVEYLLSKGKLTFSDIAEPVTKDFYRIGWNPYEIELNGKDNDISESEYQELYNKLLGV